jgi:CheY-like chemotaxis protein
MEDKMEQEKEKKESSEVVAVVNTQIAMTDPAEKGNCFSGDTYDAERSAMRSAVVNFPHYRAQIAQKHPLRILIAEDSMVNMKIALWFLKKLGYHPDVAFNGIEAIDAMKRRNYDVVFMDVEMPEMDGCEATITIRKTFPINQQPHIIAMTANMEEGDKEAYLVVGMNDYITKPLRMDDLVQALIASRPLPVVTSRLHEEVAGEASVLKVA